MAAATNSRKNSKRTIKVTRKIGPKTAALLREYGPDTQGMEMPEPNPKLTPEQQKAKDAAYIERQKAKQYHGAPIVATRLFERKMPQFKNCSAVMMIAVNDKTGTFTAMNLYNDILPASFRPEVYTYEIKQPKLDRKLEQMREVEPDEFPEFVTTAAARRRNGK